MSFLSTLGTIASIALFLSLTGCVTKRTTSEGGQVRSENYVIKRPISEMIKNTKEAE